MIHRRRPCAAAAATMGTLLFAWSLPGGGGQHPFGSTMAPSAWSLPGGGGQHLFGSTTGLKGALLVVWTMALRTSLPVAGKTSRSIPPLSGSFVPGVAASLNAVITFESTSASPPPRPRRFSQASASGQVETNGEATEPFPLPLALPLCSSRRAALHISGSCENFHNLP